MDIAGRTALVTGASRGIGRAVAVALAREGAAVVLAGRELATLEAVRGELPAGDHLALQLDVGDAASCAAALARMPRVDILIANAGIAESKPYHATDDAMWDRIMAVNATGPMRLCRALIPPMVKAGFGRVLIVASNAALTGYQYSSAYCASKHAVVGYMRAVALEIARTPVTINALCPGWVATQMAEEAVTRIAHKTGKSEAEARAALAGMSPQGRMVEPEEVAGMCLALCRPEARSIHGQTIPIDGGQVMR